MRKLKVVKNVTQFREFYINKLDGEYCRIEITLQLNGISMLQLQIQNTKKKHTEESWTRNDTSRRNVNVTDLIKLYWVIERENATCKP